MAIPLRVLILEDKAPDAELMLHGAVPFRDFYSVYPPGIYLLVAGLWHMMQ